MNDKIKTYETDQNKDLNKGLSDLFLDLYEKSGLNIDRLRQKDTEKKIKNPMSIYRNHHGRIK
tara:strand:- start:226 stop:414 length:189 start_codon:yes stop_codon:yes gene_type:complete